MEHAALDPVQHCVIRCCTCGDAVLADNVVRGMCLDCLKTESDVTAGISREATVNQCRGCERFGTEKKHQVRVLSGGGVCVGGLCLGWWWRRKGVRIQLLFAAWGRGTRA